MGSGKDFSGVSETLGVSEEGEVRIVDGFVLGNDSPTRYFCQQMMIFSKISANIILMDNVR
ncbi:MAG: hypothetical protein AAGG00_13330 [Cyanobacteria bacterium P01_H01_bin.150]